MTRSSTDTVGPPGYLAMVVSGNLCGQGAVAATSDTGVAVFPGCDGAIETATKPQLIMPSARCPSDIGPPAGRPERIPAHRARRSCRSHSRSQAPIDGDDLPGQIAGGWAGQVTDQLGDILRGPESAHGDALLHLSLDLIRQGVGHVGGDEA